MSQKIEVIKYNNGNSLISEDEIIIESPLKLTIKGTNSKITTIYIMRTPGDDKELSLGFLFTQGIISDVEDILSLETKENEVYIEISRKIDFERELLVNSSCGICGSSSMRILGINNNTNIKIKASTILSLPNKMLQKQKLFLETGGLHAAALFNTNGDLLIIKEDVGRHNAVDKLIGKALLEKIDLTSCILQVSGRAGYEIVEKAVLSKIPIISAISAPTTSAVELCKVSGSTLIGFMRENRFNIYAHPERIIIDKDKL
ncbi:formate dehydrogenase accessory sulfurtransferase FdhD [Acidianus sulfidivorans JP7]|uniref:Sulfur carrier protein FdhD n=1 Tax=Acidianus sulfidivorans JP7 TaxID=619593 RepID=A0A2U9IL82_9CREN|nr:formate dehydrogenase accessory sulfurtransferase FdhD [Acidianus sulfidivorans]AWR96777.1 formate dehydrogenase accessory sulfurtransferase FdhD [Acidianus sulfidivorans JP7]